MKKIQQVKLGNETCGDLHEKFKEKRLANLKMQPLTKDNLSERMYELFSECGDFHLFVTTKDMSKNKQVGGNSCKNRFCPNCSWKKARKDAMKISVMMKAIEQEENKVFLFLTLTTPNIVASEVDLEIKRFNSAFKKMFERLRIKNAVRGYVRKLEMTYNKERNDYNPHFHVLLAVDKKYFKRKEQYIKHEEWLKYWQEATGDYSITQVDIRRVNNNNDKEVHEIAKYSAKDTDMSVSQVVFDTFYKGLKGKRLIVFSGLFKEYAKKYENGELNDFLEVDINEYVYLLMSTWDKVSFKYDSVLQEMSQEQYERYNKMLINEIEVYDE